MRKLLFDPEQLEKESQMAKKKAGEFNRAEAVREVVKKLGKDCSTRDVADALKAAHPSNKEVAALVENLGMLSNYRNVSVKKIFGGNAKAKKSTATKKRGGGAGDSGGRRTAQAGHENNGSLSDVAIFALKHGGIEGAKAKLDELAAQIG